MKYSLTLLLAFASVFSLFAQQDMSNTSVANQAKSDTVVVATSLDTFVVIIPDVMSVILQKPIQAPSFPTPDELYADEIKTDTPFSRWGLSLRLNTYGIGLQAATSLNKNLVLRAGIDLFPVRIGYQNLDLVDELEAVSYAFGYVPGYRAKGKLEFINGHLLLDFHPVKTGIFHITAGVHIGSSKATLNGFLSDPDDNPAVLLPGYIWPTLEFGGQKVYLEGGKLNLDLKMGNTIKPYLGIGLGRAIPNKRFGFKFDIGIMYQGNYTMKQNGIEFDLSDVVVADVRDIDDYTRWLKWWPMLNFQLTYRIF